MARFVSVDDFKVGKLKLSTTNFKEDDLQSVIDEVEPSILIEMLGAALYSEFIADWDAVPINQFSEDRFQKIYYPFFLDFDYATVTSVGIKEMLMYFIYFEYIRIQAFQNRVTGTKQTKTENSQIAGFSKQGLFNTLNIGVDNYDSIQYYINDKSSDYPEFNGHKKGKTSWI